MSRKSKGRRRGEDVTSNPEADEAKEDVEKKVEVAAALQQHRHRREEERHQSQKDVHEGQAPLPRPLALVLEDKDFGMLL